MEEIAKEEYKGKNKEEVIRIDKNNSFKSNIKDDVIEMRVKAVTNCRRLAGTILRAFEESSVREVHLISIGVAAAYQALKAKIEFKTLIARKGYSISYDEGYNDIQLTKELDGEDKVISGLRFFFRKN